jgi:hypothetical protein
MAVISRRLEKHGAQIVQQRFEFFPFQNGRLNQQDTARSGHQRWIVFQLRFKFLGRRFW